MTVFLVLLGALIGYGIVSSRHDRHIETMRRIAENRGKYGPFHKNHQTEVTAPRSGQHQMPPSSADIHPNRS